jgi:hypothetical protein
MESQPLTPPEKPLFDATLDHHLGELTLFIGTFTYDVYEEYLKRNPTPNAIFIRVADSAEEEVSDYRMLQAAFKWHDTKTASTLPIQYWHSNDDFKPRIRNVLAQYHPSLVVLSPIFGNIKQNMQFFSPFTPHPSLESMKTYRILTQGCQAVLFQVLLTRQYAQPPTPLLKRIAGGWYDPQYDRAPVFSEALSDWVLLEDPHCVQKWISTYEDAWFRFEITKEGLFRKYFMEGVYNQLIEERSWFPGTKTILSSHPSQIDREKFVGVLGIMASRGQIHCNLKDSIIETKYVEGPDSVPVKTKNINYLVVDFEHVWDLNSESFDSFEYNQLTRSSFPYYMYSGNTALNIIQRDLTDMDFVLQQFGLDVLTIEEKKHYWEFLLRSCGIESNRKLIETHLKSLLDPAECLNQGEDLNTSNEN